LPAKGCGQSAMVTPLQRAAIIHSNQRITLWISTEQIKKSFAVSYLLPLPRKKADRESFRVFLSNKSSQNIKHTQVIVFIDYI
jgi:hypothetical protein